MSDNLEGIFDDDTKWTEDKLRALLASPEANPKAKMEARAELGRRSRRSNISNKTQEIVNPTDSVSGNWVLGAFGEGRDVATGLTSLLANADEAVLDPIGTGGAILEGLGDHYKTRYFDKGWSGVPGNILDVAVNNPAAAMFDASVVGTGLKLLGKGGKYGADKIANSGKVDFASDVAAFADDVSNFGNRIESLDPFSLGIDASRLMFHKAAGNRAADIVAEKYSPLSGVNDSTTRRTVIDDLLDNDLAPNPETYAQAQATREAAAPRVSEEVNKLEEMDQQAAKIGDGTAGRLFDVNILVRALQEQKQKLEGNLKTQTEGVQVIDDAIEAAIQQSEGGFISPQQFFKDKKNSQFEVNYTNDQKAAGSIEQGRGTRGAAQADKLIADVYTAFLNDASEGMAQANKDFSTAARREEALRGGADKDLTNSNDQLDQRFLNIGEGIARRQLTGQTQFERAKFFRALERGDYMQALFDESGISALGQVRRAGELRNDYEESQNIPSWWESVFGAGW